MLFFGGLWGFGGLLIGVPTFAVIYDIVKKIIYHRLIKTGKKEILRTHLNEFGKRRPRPATAEASPSGGAPEAEATPDTAQTGSDSGSDEGGGNTDEVGDTAQAADSGDTEA